MRQWRATGDQLALIGVIASCGGISSAARQLGRPKQTLSRQLAAVEAAAGSPLFDRVAGRLRPTPLAQALLPHAEQVLAAQAAASVSMAEYLGTPSGTLRIRAQAVFAQSIVAPAIGRLLRKHSALQAELRVENARAEPIDDDIDVAVTLGRPMQADLRIRVIARLPSGLYVPAAAKAAALAGQSDIARLPRVVYGRRAEMPWELTRGTDAWVLDQPAVALVNEPQAVLELLMELDQACAVLPRFMGDPMVRAGKIVAAAPDWAGQDVRIYFATPPGRSQLPSVQALAAEMEDVMHADPNWAI